MPPIHKLHTYTPANASTKLVMPANLPANLSYIILVKTISVVTIVQYLLYNVECTVVRIVRLVLGVPDHESSDNHFL